MSKVGAGLGIAIALLTWVVFGAFVGFVASKIIVKGTGFGLGLDIALGIVGAVVGGWLFQTFGISLGNEYITALFAAILGAVLVLVLIKLIRKL